MARWKQWVVSYSQVRGRCLLLAQRNDEAFQCRQGAALRINRNEEGCLIADTKTCSEYIQLVLEKSGRLRNAQIASKILSEYGITYQNNTIAKYLSFFINEGKVLSAPTESKTCFEYWWVSGYKHPIRQVDKPCPKCGSMYRRGTECNICE